MRVIYQEHDSPEQVSNSQAGSSELPSRFQRMLLWSRRRIAARAKACLIPNEERADRFRKEMHDIGTVKCVFNCPSRAEAAPRLRSHREAYDLVLWYHGSIVPPQLPDAVIKAMAIAPHKVKLKLAGYETIGHVGYLNHLQALARSLGIGDRLEYLGTLPSREQLLQHCANADAGLALFVGNTRQPMVGASNKPFDYLACGLPIIAPDTSEWRDFFVQPGYGIACHSESPESIAAAIGWLVEHREEARAMGEAGRRHIIDAWNYETQFAPVEAIMSYAE
jgi:glycosyltransferase involved in cell wall biosynthesis